MATALTAFKVALDLGVGVGSFLLADGSCRWSAWSSSESGAGDDAR